MYIVAAIAVLDALQTMFMISICVKTAPAIRNVWHLLMFVAQLLQVALKLSQDLVTPIVSLFEYRLKSASYCNRKRQNCVMIPRGSKNDPASDSNWRCCMLLTSKFKYGPLKVKIASYAFHICPKIGCSVTVSAFFFDNGACKLKNLVNLKPHFYEIFFSFVGCCLFILS